MDEERAPERSVRSFSVDYQEDDLIQHQQLGNESNNEGGYVDLNAPGLGNGNESNERPQQGNPLLGEPNARNNGDDNQQRRDRAKPFLIKLHRMIDTAEEMGLGSAISWSEDGRGFFIGNKDELSETVLPQFFPNVSKVESFQRNFNRYGITMTRSGPLKGLWYHEDPEDFSRGVFDQPRPGQQNPQMNLSVASDRSQAGHASANNRLRRDNTRAQRRISSSNTTSNVALASQHVAAPSSAIQGERSESFAELQQLSSVTNTTNFVSSQMHVPYPTPIRLEDLTINYRPQTIAQTETSFERVGSFQTQHASLDRHSSEGLPATSPKHPKSTSSTRSFSNSDVQSEFQYEEPTEEQMNKDLFDFFGCLGDSIVEGYDAGHGIDDMDMVRTPNGTVCVPKRSALNKKPRSRGVGSVLNGTIDPKDLRIRLFKHGSYAEDQARKNASRK